MAKELYRLEAKVSDTPKACKNCQSWTRYDNLMGNCRIRKVPTMADYLCALHKFIIQMPDVFKDIFKGFK